ncbi:hypothetical protein [Clostridium uliginosum]|uniref:Uncharacterized protein n=1 Tax=Clostridium uliginosum TaxID=119641 RepID=A0A1I1NNZ5_9CLOT|nr:hypothetical protein [Clostridium uliginosum]SFC96483.1 hypothetical protein SAMN05421842_11535 [Clostridium uliginosum]
MRKYIKNKNFISKKFYNQKVQDEENKQNRICALFIIIDLVLFPIALEKIQEFKDKSINCNNNIEQVSEPTIKLENVSSWINNIIIDGIECASITQDGGKIEINNLEILKTIESNEYIKINSLISNANGNYTLGVELNE